MLYAGVKIAADNMVITLLLESSVFLKFCRKCCESVA